MPNPLKLTRLSRTDVEARLTGVPAADLPAKAIALLTESGCSFTADAVTLLRKKAKTADVVGLIEADDGSLCIDVPSGLDIEFSNPSLVSWARSYPSVFGQNLGIAGATPLPLNFDAIQGERPGDYVALRGRKNVNSPHDATWELKKTPWTVFRRPGTDTSNAELYWPLLAVKTPNSPAGKVTVGFYDNVGGVEPFASIKVTNTRTLESVEVKANFQGRIDKFYLAAESGDILNVALSDGINNLDWSDVADTIVVGEGATAGRTDESEPRAWLSVGDERFALNELRLPGTLDVPPTVEYIKQGRIADCYVISTLQGLADYLPELVTDQGVLRQLGPDSYALRLFERKEEAGKPTTWTPFQVKGNGALYQSPTGTGNAFAEAPLVNTHLGERRLVWPAIVEKLFAVDELKRRGKTPGTDDFDIDAISFGNTAQTLERFLGTPFGDFKLTPATKEAFWARAQLAKEAGVPLVVTTPPDFPGMTGTGMPLYHSFLVRGVREEGGKRLVRIREAYGKWEKGSTGRLDGLDGEMELELDELLKFCTYAEFIPDDSVEQYKAALVRDGLLTESRAAGLKALAKAMQEKPWKAEVAG